MGGQAFKLFIDADHEITPWDIREALYNALPPGVEREDINVEVV
jgi:hypothetical protein